MMAAPNALDPILGQALQMEQRPVRHDRQSTELEASNLMQSLERVGSQLERERDPMAMSQLKHICESLGVLIIGLMAYNRGLVPRVANKAPNTSVIVQ
jgi:hypothetical protein